ncbi:MAG: UDP-N-acetylglucosamine 1-carboxyvinyltransferase [Candidatus Margulisiibacteriota bacterium]|jgi:UDP-N-acetylglucosamine 1-carboxyvinyltransferase
MGYLKIIGGKRLIGDVYTSGAKNAALPILAASIMLEGETELTNIPYLKDIVIMIRMLNSLGVRAEYCSPNKVKIWNNRKIRHIAPYDLVTAMRASFFVAGPILAKTGLAKVPLPGGCAIGSRPIDIHLKGFKALGAEINIEHGFVELKAKKLKGTHILLPFPSVGATENILMAASIIEGTTIIENAAQEPEITDLIEFLRKAGANIEGDDSSIITIKGVPVLKGIEYNVIPDRIEAGTLLIAGAITKGDVTVKPVVLSHLEALIVKLEEIGLTCKYNPEDKSVRVIYEKELNAVDIETMPYPGFPTDMQAQIMALLTISNGTSTIKETIFENRFMHVNELVRMGAVIKIQNNCAMVEGVKELTGAETKITDLRAGAALVLAGLVANGESTIYGLKHLRRGYENLSSKLRNLGAEIID